MHRAGRPALGNRGAQCPWASPRSDQAAAGWHSIHALGSACEAKGDQVMATYTPTDVREYLDGKIVTHIRQTGRGNPSLRYKATTAKGRASPMLRSERDARRWIDEHQTGGNPAGFLNELQRRRRWSRG